MKSFLQEYPNSTGARFIHLLKAELHARPEWEPHRQSFCGRILSLCIGGYHNANAKMPASSSSSSVSSRFSTSLDRLFNFYNGRDYDTYLPLLPQTDSTTVHGVRHFRDTEHAIANLGTSKACLPLMLAAASIDPEVGTVVELGPFAGFSSNCAAYGILAAMQNRQTAKRKIH
ncbi:hypothetical protein IV203_007568 [Nitzschia inconspicua]|uniref:Uncharacterized protein n=1 Tax=Nitzschia inconspicua TaxID=303405 RepID=A0A9K3PD28_9STRA|nr:hypothetical protein IV203_007568 [Nitzschia inconspicua]